LVPGPPAAAFGILILGTLRLALENPRPSTTSFSRGGNQHKVKRAKKNGTVR
jgi:hypothetical protein